MGDASEHGNSGGAPERAGVDGALEREGVDGALERAKVLRLMIFDVDGVMTDGMLYYSARGEELKAFNIQDGLGIKLLRQQGVEVALITARRSQAVERRAADLGIAQLHQGIEDKRGAYATLLGQLGLAAEQSGYMGDDLLDLPLITRCGFAATVPAAPQALKSRAHYVTQSQGGHGAVREVCELILRAQGALDRAIGGYLR